jgi:hypothetical protein
MALGRKTGGGSRAGKPNRSTANVKALAGKYTTAAMAELGRLALEAESEAARVAAIKELFDRAYGRPTQVVAGDEEGAPILHAIQLIGVVARDR